MLRSSKPSLALSGHSEQDSFPGAKFANLMASPSPARKKQSLPSSVNFEFVNKIIIPEMHYNNAGMSQFYMRFVRYTSTEKKDLYFPIYIGSLESNLMQMVLAKEKLTMFMKGQDADMDEIYAKFGVDYDLLSTLMTRETDDEGHLRIHWGEQKIA